jgi:glucose/arabinose dehydrogenase
MFLFCACVASVLGVVASEDDAASLLSTLHLPTGFRIELFSSGMNQPRSMDLSPSGTIFVGSLNDTVYAVKSDGSVHTVATGLHEPNGVAYHNATGDLYIATLTALLRVRNVEANLSGTVVPEVVSTEFFDADAIWPIADWHGFRYIRIRGDQLFMTIGSPCNTPADPADDNSTCKCFWPGHGCSYPTEKLDYLGSVLRGDLPGFTNITRIAHGVRNSVGITFTPNGDLWFTDNGRDQWDPDHSDRPPDELNVVRHNDTTDHHYGFPFCFGVDLVDHQFNSHNSCAAPYVGAAQPLGAHVASLGLRYYTGSMFPNSFRNMFIIAEHGSWDADPPTGYRLTMVDVDDQWNPVSYNKFVSGFLVSSVGMDTTAWGRLADVEVLADGSVLVTNDRRGEIYRITYVGDMTIGQIYAIVFGCVAVFVVLAIGAAIHAYMQRSRQAKGFDKI